jgi:hypothetical protein
MSKYQEYLKETMLLDYEPLVYVQVSFRLAELQKSHCRIFTRHGDQILSVKAVACMSSMIT